MNAPDQRQDDAPPPRRWKRRIRLGAIGLLGLLAGCSAVGFSVQTIATWKAGRDYPPPGELVDVGGYHLHLLCTGPTTGPTVVLEAGFAGWTVDWVELQPVVAQDLRVCSYDRAGFGWSEPGPPEHADAAGVARTLHRLLAAADVPGPYVLVGHSLGGIYVRQFAHLYPNEVHGLVLLDSTHEEVLQRLPEDTTQGQLDQLRLLRVARYLTPLGIQRVLRQPLANVDEATPDWWHDAGVALGYRSDSYFAAYDQVHSLLGASRSGALQVPEIPAIPLAVLYSRGAVEEFGTTWIELQDELTALSHDAELTYLHDSGHDVQRDETEAVAATIKRIAHHPSN